MDATATVVPSAAAIVARVPEQPQRQKRSKRRTTTARQIKRNAESAEDRSRQIGQMEMDRAQQLLKDSAVQAAAGHVEVPRPIRSNGVHAAARRAKPSRAPMARKVA